MNKGQYWTGRAWVTPDEMRRTRHTLPHIEGRTEPNSPPPRPRQEKPDVDSRPDQGSGRGRDE